MTEENRLRLLIIGGGPAGGMAASVAASLGADVTLVEDSIIGGAAHLLDCIPSKTMVASSVRRASVRDSAKLGFVVDAGHMDLTRLAGRIDTISSDLAQNITSILEDQDVRIVHGRGSFTGPNTAVAETAVGSIEIEFDRALISTGSAPRVPDWVVPDGEKILTTRDAYDFETVPEHMVVIGSGVTGVEFVNIFSSMGSKVSLLVSRQQVLPHRDPEVAAAIEADFLVRGVSLLKGARAVGIDIEKDGVVIRSDDGPRLSSV